MKGRGKAKGDMSRGTYMPSIIQKRIPSFEKITREPRLVCKGE